MDFLLGLALSWVVARAVFAPGCITYHRIMGAILLYLTIGVTFVALYTFVGLLDSAFIFRHVAERQPDICQHNDLFQLRHADDRWIRRHFRFAPIARSLTNVEAMIGQLYPATLLARIVTLEIEGEKT